MTKSELRIIIGENIRTIRLSRNISIDELSEMLDLTSGFVGLIERGERGTTPNTIYRLSEIFDVPIDTLYRRDLASALSLAEESLDAITIRRKKIASLVSGLSQVHMDFIIEVIKDVRMLKDSCIEEG